MKMAIVVLAAAAGLAAAGCGSHQGGPPGGFGGGGFSFPVSAAPITKGTITQTFSVTGAVTPLQSASLSSVASGNILFVGAQIGQHVTRGELLVKIDDSQLSAQLQSAGASLQSAQARLEQTRASSTGDVASTDASLASARAADQTAQLNLQRNQQLKKQGFVSQSAVDQAWSAAMAARAQLRSAQVAAQNAALSPRSSSAALANLRNSQAEVAVAQSQVATIEAALAQTNVRAPFDGVVVSRNVDPGSLAAPGTTLMEVAQLDPVYVNAGISGNNLQYVRVGTPATITVATIPNRAWQGSVKFFNLSAVPGTLTYLVRIPIANPDAMLRGGMVADVAFEQARKSDVLLAPRAAVFQTDAGFSMFVIDSASCPPHVTACAKSVPVEIGLENDQQMEVSGPGLKAGMQAILNHAATLQPGMPVQAIPAQGPAGPPGAPAQKKPTK
jgi:HlyD family secretion protein